MSIAYGFNEKGYFTGIVPMQRNPIRKTEFLAPSNATLVQPPTGYTEEQQPMFNEDLQVWLLVESEYKINLDAEKLQLVDEYGVHLYEEDMDGNIIQRPVEDVQADGELIIKEIAIRELKNVMDSNIINKALEITRGSSIESASAFFQGYILRASNAAEYVNDGLIVHYSYGNFSLGEALDTETKIVEYYNSLNILMDKFRNSEINNYLAAKLAAGA